jgi:phosphoesterase RecJ-like protein
MIQRQILDQLKKFSSFLVVAHIHPEGDSIGSQLAMANLLKSMGKKVRIVNSDNVPKNLLFLPGSDQVMTLKDIKQEEIEFDSAVVLDCPTLDRIGDVRQLLENLFIISIDHHVSNENFGDINWTDAHASSAGEMVYELFKKSQIDIDDESALCLYVAIMTDTGSFRYSNTTVDTHQIIADLLKSGINPTKVYETIYETKPFEVMKLLAEVLMNLKRSDDGKCVWFKVTDQMLSRNNLKAEATEDFIAFVRMVEGAEVVAFLRELSENKVKVSLRSKTDIDVNQIASVFGGGGHRAASGCVIENSIEQAEKLLIEQINIAIKKNNK